MSQRAVMVLLVENQHCEDHKGESLPEHRADFAVVWAKPNGERLRLSVCERNLASVIRRVSGEGWSGT